MGFRTIEISTNNYLVLGKALVFYSVVCTSGYIECGLYSGQAWVFLVHHGCSSELLGPIPHDSLHSSPFYLKGPWTAATGKRP